MTTGFAIVEGVCRPLEDATLPLSDLSILSGWSVFETFVVRSDELPRSWETHTDRLLTSCTRALLPKPDLDVLKVEVLECARRCGYPSRVRVTVTGSGRHFTIATPLDEKRKHQDVRAVTAQHWPDPLLGDAKHSSRCGWVVARQRSGADEVIWLDHDGAMTEGTQSGVLAVQGGTLWTAPHDGSILVSTTVLSILERAAALGIPIRRERPRLTPALSGLYIASVTRDIAPVVELDGEPLPDWEPLGRAIADLSVDAS